MFETKTAKEIRRIIKSCEDYQILCKLGDGGLPMLLFAGHDATGKKIVASTHIDEGWVQHARCSGQFVAQIVDQIRALLGNSPKSANADRAAVLGRVFLQGSLLPLLDRD
jgi:hypothetical protein